MPTSIEQILEHNVKNQIDEIANLVSDPKNFKSKADFQQAVRMKEELDEPADVRLQSE